nr:alkaline ceramidase [Mammaliicoccus sp. Marseille-Q6498]
MMTLGAVKSVNINPPMGINFLGYHRDRPIESILHDLYAMIYYFKNNETELLLVSIDNVALLKEFSDEIRNEISNATNIKVEDIILTFSHTHSGPATADGKEITNRYCDELKEKLVETSFKCLGEATEIEVSWSIDQVNVSDNRRELVDGMAVMGIRKNVQIDNRIAFLNIRKKDNKQNIGLLIFMSSHPNILKSDSYGLSNDYISVIRKKTESSYNNVSVIQLGTGNLNPKWRGKQSDLEIIADKVTEVLFKQHFEFDKINDLKTYNKQLNVKLMKNENKEQIYNKAKYASKVWGLNTDKWKNEMFDRLGEQFNLDVEISGFALNDGVFIGIPFEPFYEMSLKFKEDLQNELALFGGYTNGYYGYLPHESEYQYSGYEVDINAVVYGPLTGLWMPVKFEESKKVITNAINLIKDGEINCKNI